MYYSRTGNTKKVGEEIAKTLGADSDEIVDRKNRQGILGWLKAGWDARRGKRPEIEVQKDPRDYDLIIVGTPIWGGKMTPAVRTYLNDYDFTDKKMAFFTTEMGGKPVETIEEMEEIAAEAQIKGSLCIKQDDIQNNNYEAQLSDFLQDLE